jgi:hypothetical protein
MRKYLAIYEEAVTHIWLCDRSLLNFLIYEENLLFLFISVVSSWGDGVLHRVHRVATATVQRTHHHHGKSPQAGEIEVCTPTPFYYIYHHVKSCGVRSSWEGRFTYSISTIPLYVLYGVLSRLSKQRQQSVKSVISYLNVQTDFFIKLD